MRVGDGPAGMIADLDIRPARDEDAAVMAGLAATLGYPVTEEVLRSRVRVIAGCPADRLLVAVIPGGRVVGWLQAHASNRVHSGRVVEIVGLVVDQGARRQGVARRLVAEARHWAETRSADLLVVRSDLRRTESHRLFPALGFRLNKRQAVYRIDRPGSRADA